MTPGRFDESEDFLERLRERVDTMQPLQPEEVEIVVHRMRELLDEIVQMSATISRIPNTSALIRRLLKAQRTWRNRCCIAHLHLQRGDATNAMRVLSPALDEGKFRLPSGDQLPGEKDGESNGEHVGSRSVTLPRR